MQNVIDIATGNIAVAIATERWENCESWGPAKVIAVQMKGVKVTLESEKMSSTLDPNLIYIHDCVVVHMFALLS